MSRYTKSLVTSIVTKQYGCGNGNIMVFVWCGDNMVMNCTVSAKQIELCKDKLVLDLGKGIVNIPLEGECEYEFIEGRCWTIRKDGLEYWIWA